MMPKAWRRWPSCSPTATASVCPATPCWPAAADFTAPASRCRKARRRLRPGFRARQGDCRRAGLMLGAPQLITPYPNFGTRTAGPAIESTCSMDEGNVTSSLNLGNGEDTAPSAGIISQYVKDLSVENPNAPECFQWQDAPQLDVQFNIAARPIQADIHEVQLKIQLNAKA